MHRRRPERDDLHRVHALVGHTPPDDPLERRAAHRRVTELLANRIEHVLERVADRREDEYEIDTSGPDLLARCAGGLSPAS